MMGEQGGNQERLFHLFNLEDHVPAEHLLRGVDHFKRIVLRRFVEGHVDGSGPIL